jgi:hypothetical protein
MAGTLHTPLNYKELYGEPTNNPSGILPLDQAECLRAVYEMWRATGLPCTVAVLYQNVLAGWTISGIGVCVPDEDSDSGVLWILHSVHSYPGAPGMSRYHMKTLCFEGDVSEVDIATMDFDEQQLEITADSIVPGSVDQMLQILSDEPTKELFGPFAATEATLRNRQCPLYGLPSIRGDGLNFR